MNFRSIVISTLFIFSDVTAYNLRGHDGVNKEETQDLRNKLDLIDTMYETKGAKERPPDILMFKDRIESLENAMYGSRGAKERPPDILMFKDKI